MGKTDIKLVPIWILMEHPRFINRYLNALRGKVLHFSVPFGKILMNILHPNICIFSQPTLLFMVGAIVFCVGPLRATAVRKIHAI